MPTISIWVPEHENVILKETAKKENRSVSNMVATLIRGMAITGSSSIPAPADADKSVQPIPYIKVSKVATAPVAGVDYDPDAPMCQDDYEALTKTGQYKPQA